MAGQYTHAEIILQYVHELHKYPTLASTFENPRHILFDVRGRPPCPPRLYRGAQCIQFLYQEYSHASSKFTQAECLYDANHVTPLSYAGEHSPYKSCRIEIEKFRTTEILGEQITNPKFAL